MEKKKYYKFIGYTDGSGRPAGLIIKLLTDKEYKHKLKCGLVYQLMGGQKL